MTSGHNLPNPYVIHTRGPVYGRDKPEEQLLAASYRNSLARAEGERLKKVRLVRFVLFSGSDLEVHEKALKALTS